MHVTPPARDSSPAAPQKENQKRADNENHDSSRPQEPSAFAAISSDDHTARRQKQNGEDNPNSCHSPPFNFSPRALTT